MTTKKNKQPRTVKQEPIGPTWWLPVKPADQADEAGVSEVDQRKQLYVAAQDAMSWCIEGDYGAKDSADDVYYGYATPVGGIFHHKGKTVPRVSAGKGG